MGWTLDSAGQRIGGRLRSHKTIQGVHNSEFQTGKGKVSHFKGTISGGGLFIVSFLLMVEADMIQVPNGLKPSLDLRASLSLYTSCDPKTQPPPYAVVKSRRKPTVVLTLSLDDPE